MKNFVIINGVNSNTINGLGINELPPISKPSMRVLTEEIDGRDGDITTNLGYSAYDKTITIGLWGTGYDVNSIISFFTSEGTITFSNEPDKYYKFTMLEQIDVESLLRFKTASITFHCQPFKYPLEEEPLEIEYEYVNGEGESITLDNTEEDVKMSIQPKGNTSQDSTTGYALYDFINNAYAKEGNLTITKLDNGYTITNNDTIEARIIFNGVSVDSSKNYVISFDLINASGSRVRVGWVGSSKIIATYSTSGKQAQSFTGITTSAFSIYVGTGQTITITNLMIYEGTDLTKEYEPYTNGASPNPDYPQEIHSVTGDNEIVVCGKNLFDKSKTTIGKIVSRTTGTLDTNASYGTTDFIPVVAGEQYRLTGFNYWYTAVYDKNKEYLSNVDNTPTITIPNGAYYLRSSFQLTNIDTAQFEKGSTATTYEPYTSQTYPISLGTLELCKIGDYQDYFTKNSGKNLLNLNRTEISATSSSLDILDTTKCYNGMTRNDDKYNNNVTKTINSDGSWTLSTPNGYYGLAYPVEVEGNTEYIVSGVIDDNTKFSFGIGFYDENGTYISNDSSWHANYRKFTTPANCKIANICLCPTLSNTSVTISNIQLEKGATATTYEPYGTGLWCKYNAIGKVVLDGSESWDNARNTTDTNIYFSTGIIDGLNIPNFGISNIFRYNANLWTDDETGFVIIGTNHNLRVRIPANLLSDISSISQARISFVSWLSTHNTTVYYVLATPYLSLIEDTNLIEQLNNIQNAMSYEGQTNISQVNNDKPFIISAKALEKGSDKVVVNNIGNATSKPLIALEGTGNINIYLDGTQVLQANVEDKMNIDIDKLEAYNPDTSALLNRQVIGNYNSMTIPSGESIIKIDGALDKATITNYQRWL